ncbi:hypothetical protein LLEC1_05140 [Akanthomyces lecanii]|uniref:UDP-N-acetylglucosamine transferase subunit ALG13 n=1 Tax=Cordyceps confragosa TaxID=2714763 RepID=A0A179IAR3_CORDF|nr:hypothetical protein LLEC1_05140 [Akanthomyces lecanii]
MAAPERTKRYCLVTVGATVGFRTLTAAVLEPDFWRHLAAHGFTELRVQCGPDEPWAAASVASQREAIPASFSIEVFASRDNLLMEEMALCKASGNDRSKGLIIGHAGTGTILDAWRLDVPMVVVPNTDLLNDHQTEMARHLAKEGYATQARAERDDLKEAVDKARLLEEENKSRNPPHAISSRDRLAVRLWDIVPEEVQEEQNQQMSTD